MADKIKSFFQKQKKNSKFKNAGKGHKLNESPSSSQASSSKDAKPAVRVEPTSEAKIAGQAALQRFQAKKPDPTKFNTSYAAIQARVKRELEAERKALEEQRLDDKPEISESKEEIIDNPILAVRGVYFKCPIISDEVLSKDEWRKRIREFLYEQLKDEDAGITACLIIYNCNVGKEKIENCVDTLKKYLENIINNPTEEKYWKIRMGNKVFQDKVLPLEGVMEFFKVAGFTKELLAVGDKPEEDYFVWSPEYSTIDNLTMLVEVLQTAEPIPIEVDRNVHVLLPNQAATRNELPPDFFTVSKEELKREQQIRSEIVAKGERLMTKAMREKEELQMQRKYRYTLIRVRFPDNIMMQGTFGVYEKFEKVVEFVKENLHESDVDFTLASSLGQKFTAEDNEKTLFDLRLVPAAIIAFTCDAASAQNAHYLKEDVLCLVESYDSDN